MQIDVIRYDGTTVVCILSTGERDVRILLHLSDYEQLIKDRFFIRDGKSKDSAGVLNTTRNYLLDLNETP